MGGLAPDGSARIALRKPFSHLLRPPTAVRLAQPVTVLMPVDVAAHVFFRAHQKFVLCPFGPLLRFSRGKQMQGCRQER